MEQRNDSQINILCLCDEISTCILLESALDPDFFKLEYSRGDETLMEGMRKRAHDIFIVDICHDCRERRLNLLQRTVEQELDGPVRILLLLDRVPPEAADKLQPFGPLCFLECFFSRSRLRGAIAKIMDMEVPDAGVTDNSRVFDFTIYAKDKLPGE